MASKYEICADEAWTHESMPPNRYWCFLGGLLGLESDVDRLESALRAQLAAAGHRAEVKWGATSPVTLALFCGLIDTFFAHLVNHDLHYRQTFLDRSHVYVPAPGEPQRSGLDVQFMVYYQFFKHHFGLEHLPGATRTDPHQILLRLDNHSSQAHKADLASFVQSLPAQIGRRDLSIYVTFVDSKQFRRLQVCDLAMGAAGSFGNRLHDRRSAGQRGMKPRQKARYELARYIYNHLRALDHATRGSKVFNWFESTSNDGAPANNFQHKIRIWKFVPKNHKIDYGFRNKYVGKQGEYLGSRWQP